jgi:tRNA G37 N-methylase Trm5
MSKGILKNAVQISHMIVAEVVAKGDTVVDASCGRGKDTLFLANLVGENGRVYTFDIQEPAIESTRDLLLENGLLERVVLLQEDHRNISQYVNSGVKACMFNLGYLPGGDHNIKTEADSTLEALKGSLDILAQRGIITLVFYPGHPGGQIEMDLIRDYLSGLSQQDFEISEIRFINQTNDPPQIIIVEKLHGGI